MIVFMINVNGNSFMSNSVNSLRSVKLKSKDIFGILADAVHTLLAAGIDLSNGLNLLGDFYGRIFSNR